MNTRLFNRSAQLAVDVVVLVLAYVVAFLCRFEGAMPASMLRVLVWTLPYAIALQYAIMVVLGVHRLAWRYIAIPDVRRIGLAVLAAMTVELAFRFAAEAMLPSYPLVARAIVPISVIVMSATFAFLGVTGVRVARRMFAERSESVSRRAPRHEPVRTLLVGAGRAGVMVAKEIGARPDLGILPLGFVDDDALKVGTLVHDLRVHGTTQDLADIATRVGATQVLITMANAPGKEVRRIVQLCEQASLTVKIIPGVYEIVGGQVNLSRIRKVAIEDLLRREPVHLDEEAIANVVADRVVLVTGAGGSIGSELCRQVCRFRPKRLVLVEHSENSLFYIERELRNDHPELDILPFIADIRDARRIDEIFGSEKPHAVFHAAAHKHVPLMEANPAEAVKNNVVGTKVLAELADAHGVSEFVMISTDKAVNPSSIMGVSKRAAEIFVQALSQRSKTRFVAVRFGNVLGSAGSVVPIFEKQIEAGGPVTVTDAEMKRYFMTIPEACQLVMQAATMGKGGDIFVLDMGEPVKILDLARDLIRLSGLREGDDIEIEITGVRPGEKLFEELSFEEEKAEKTKHEKIFIGRLRPHPWEQVTKYVSLLAEAAESGDAPRVRELFLQFVPEYRPAANGRSVAPPPVVAELPDVAPVTRPSQPLVPVEA